MMWMDDATQFPFDEDMPPPRAPALGRSAAAASSSSFQARPHREARIFPRAQSQQDRPAEPRDPPTVFAPFGEIQAIPGVDYPAPPPYGSRSEVIVIDDDDAAGQGIIDLSHLLPPRPHSRRGNRRPPDASKVVDVDGAGLDEPQPFHSRRRSQTPRPPQPRDPDLPPPRLGRSIYDAVQSQGHFGMVDSGESDGSVRRLLVHVPKRSRGYILDIHPGEVIQANSGRGRPIGGRLEVKYVTRHQYFAPGRAVTSCAIGVPEHQWQRFM